MYALAPWGCSDKSSPLHHLASSWLNQEPALVLISIAVQGTRYQKAPPTPPMITTGYFVHSAHCCIHCSSCKAGGFPTPLNPTLSMHTGDPSIGWKLCSVRFLCAACRDSACKLDHTAVRVLIHGLINSGSMKSSVNIQREALKPQPPSFCFVHLPCDGVAVLNLYSCATWLADFHRPTMCATSLQNRTQILIHPFFSSNNWQSHLFYTIEYLFVY